jgi:hypothetical protein
LAAVVLNISAIVALRFLQRGIKNRSETAVI